jgi:toxin ParE1/3/4
LYIAQDNLEAARRVHSQIHKVFITIARQPNIGRRRDEVLSGVRSLAVGKYVMYYRQADGTARILRILHGAREIEDLNW